MQKIPLSQQGKYKGRHFALVDDEDYLKVSKYRWSVSLPCGYAERRIKGKLERMHRFIMNVPKGFMIDHVNMNGLDNRRKNLRICTKAENMRNRNKTRLNKSGYKGVYLDFNNKWKAQLKKGKKVFNLGRFNTKEEAAMAYNTGAIKYFGPFANLNKI